MKKTMLFMVILLLVTLQAYCKDKIYNLSNNLISIDLTQTNDNLIYFSNLTNKNTNTNVILKDIGKKANIWTLVVKKSREYNSPEITLSAEDAKNVFVQNNKNSITLIWTNVKKSFMSNGFDVIVTGNLKSDGTYWNIKVNSKTKDYGIWNITFPEVIINFQDGDEFFSPLFGGLIETKNTKTRPEGHGYKNVSNVTYPVGDMPYQLVTITKKSSGIYLCPEDANGWHKIFSYPSLNNKEIDYYITVMPNDQGVGGVNYKQDYLFNICAFDGDWFNAVKKYRKWGIANNDTPFKKGRLKDRTDVPEWLKKNCFWGNEYEKSVAGNIPTAFHLYGWWHLPHDVGYPEMLPANEDVVQSWMKRAKNNFKLIYYTNPHLIDAKNSPLYQKYGDEICNLEANLKPKDFHWAEDLTTNHASCPSLDIIQDTVVNLQKTLIKTYNADGVYLDELSMIGPEPCFNEKHGHPVGTGNRWSKEYSKLIERIMIEGSKVKGDPIVVFSEGTAEPLPTVAQLDLMTSPDMPYCKSALYSGYRILFAMQYNKGDVEPSQQPGIAKLAYTLCGGWQLGWYQFFEKPLEQYVDYSKYLKNAAQARYSAVDYFNLGEMVRAVKITNDIPYIDTVIALNPTEDSPKFHVPSVQTSSFDLDDKTMIVFTNITTNEQKVNWESKAEDLYLKDKASYKISETFPNKKDLSNTDGKIYGSLTMTPLETKIIIVE